MTESQEKQGYILDTSDDDTDQTAHDAGQESYRGEIEDIVRGFILEKDIMSQGHEEEMVRMKESFHKEKIDLLRHLEEEREALRQNSRVTSISSNETGYASGSHDPEACNLNFYSGERASVSSGKRETTSLSSRDIDNNLIKEIAEVYLRMNNGLITSRIRPDLDLEDKFEREREIFERKFVAEKRELKRKLEDDYHYKLEQEKNRYEGQIQELKTAITDLQWQKRELESRNRNDKEKNEINFERERNEIEKRHLQTVHDIKRRLEEKYSADIVKQKDKYEENITVLQDDISKLTSQLRELNENLRQEKEVIVDKFEREIREMETTFSDQRNTLKISLESEFALKLDNETSVLKNINKTLKEDFENLEHEKKDTDRKHKEERKKLEEHYEKEIAEMEKRHSEEKRNIKSKIEERYQQIIANEQTSVEVTINELREEVMLLRQENAQIDSAFSERNEELRQQLNIERDDYKKKWVIDREELKIRLENEFHQKMLNESSGHLELVQQLDRDLGIMKARYGELEGNMTTMRQERDMLVREREEMQRKYVSMEFELEKRTNTPRAESRSDGAEVDKLKDIIRKKEQEISTVNLQKEQTEIAMSSLKREKNELEDEIANLKRKFSSRAIEDTIERPKIDNSELVSLQETVKRKDEEIQCLKRDKFELDFRNSSLQRKNEEMEDELSALRRKKLEVEDEISSIKRDKSDTENQISVLRKEKIGLEEGMGTLRKKQAELEENVSAFRRENKNMEHEITLLKRTIDNLEEELRIQKQKFPNEQEIQQQSNRLSPRVLRVSSTQKANLLQYPRRKHDDNYYHSESEINQQDAQIVFGESDKGYDIFNDSTRSIENNFDELIRQNRELEGTVQRLEESRAELQSEISKLKHQGGSTTLVTSQKEGMESKLETLKEEYLDLENRILKLRREEGGLEGHINDLKNNEQDLKWQINDLNIEEKRMLKDIERFQEEKEKLQNSMKSTQESAQQQGNGSRVTGISQVSIERVRKHENKDHELAELRKERDSLKKELMVLKKNLGGNHVQQSLKQQQNDNLSEHNYSKEMKEIEENEVFMLKKDRLQLEKSVSALQRQKIEVDAEVNVMLESKKREEKELSSLRRERMELDTLIATLSSKKTRLEAELSVIRDEKKKDDSGVDLLRREKHEMEKQFYDLKSKKTKMEAELSMTEMAWKNKDNSITELHSNSLKMEQELKELRNERSEIESEIKRLQSVKRREENELNILRKQMKDLQSQISESVRVAEQVKHSFSTSLLDRNVGDQTWTQTDVTKVDRGSTSLREDSYQSLYPSKPRIRTSIEIPPLGTRGPDGRARSYGTSESFLIPSNKSDTQNREKDQTFIDSSTPSGDMIGGERGYTCGYHVRFSDNGQVTTFSGPKRSIDNNGFQRNSHQNDKGIGTGVTHSGQDYVGSYFEKNSEITSSVDNYEKQEGYRTKDNNGNQHGQANQNRCYLCSTLSNGDSKVKEDNDIMFLRREKHELESQINELRAQLKKIQAEVNELENIKIVRETINGRSEEGDYRQKDEDFHKDFKTELVQAKFEERNDNIRQEYEHQLEELIVKNTELKQQVGLLEWQVENTKQKMEIQEMSFRRELSGLKEKYSLSNGVEVDSDSTKLKEFYQHLSYVLDKKISNEEIIKEIRTAIKELEHHKVINVYRKNSNANLSGHQSSYSYDEKVTSKNTGIDADEAKSAREYASQLKIQLEIADTQLKTCEKIIHRLYAENSDLNKLVLKLDGKLKSASRSTEKLQRKRALLQKLVEKLSGHVGKDQLRQAYLVLELDRDIAI